MIGYVDPIKNIPTVTLDAEIHRILGLDGDPLRYSSDLNATFVVEEEILRRGLEMAYQDALWTTASCEFPNGANGESFVIGLLPLIHATAEQRCRAAIAALLRPPIDANEASF